MKKSINYLAITTCFLLGTTVAHANPDLSQENMHDQIFKTMDTNSDGMVTRDEFLSFGKKKFQEIDVNGDGQITGEEIKAAQRKMEGSGSRRNKMEDSGRDLKGKTRAESDNSTTTSQSSGVGGRSNTSWTSRDTSATKSSNTRNDSWDKKRDDSWHQHMDSWDKTRDDAWHKANDNDDDDDEDDN